MQLVRCVFVFLFARQLHCASENDGVQVFFAPQSVGTDAPFDGLLVDNSTEAQTPSTVSHDQSKGVPKSADENQSLTQKVTYLPKCCPEGYIINTINQCELFKNTEYVKKLELKLLRGVRQYTQNLDHGTIELVYSNSTHNALTCPSSQQLPLRDSYYSPGASQNVTPTFAIAEHNETIFYVRFYYEDIWDIDYRLAQYCADVKLTEAYGVKLYDAYAFYCMPPSRVSIHYPIMLYISSIGLLVTFLMYFITPTKGAARVLAPGGAGPRSGLKGRKVRMASLLTGRNLLCHISSLFFAFISLAITQQEILQNRDYGCIAIGYIVYVTCLASFTWLTIYCFDYFWMFRGSFKVSNSLLFIPYSLFGWGIPTIALVIALIGQFYPAANFPKSLNPNMGALRCFFGDEKSSLIYFYAPISFLISLNIIFFMSLLLNPNLMNCRRKNKGGPQLRSTKTKADESQRNDLKMALKLFFITGVPWVCEIFAWLPSFFAYESGIDVKEEYRVLTIVFEVLNLVDALRGVIVFVLFVLLQRDVRAQFIIQLKKIATEIAVLPSKLESIKSISTSSQRNASSEASHSANSAANQSSSKQSTGSGKQRNPAISNKPDPHSSEPVEEKDTHNSSRRSSEATKESIPISIPDYDPYQFDPAEITIL